MSSAAGVKFGPYLLLRKIAAGGMAEIYEGELQGLAGFKRKVAIKRILPQFCDDEIFVKMLLDEARIAARLMHPNIAQVINCGEVDGSYFIAMEYVDGQSLSRVLKRLARDQLPLDMAHCMYVVISLLRALDVAHKATDDDGQPMRVVHRDVSPQNLLISYSGEVKLVDFGVASASDKLHKTETGAVKGKLAYMAPEQLAGNDIDHRLDQYAAALVLFEAICGVRAYSGKSEVDVIQRVLLSNIEDLEGRLTAAGAKPELIAIIQRALSREREERFADCAAFADALTALLENRDLLQLQRQLAEVLLAHVPRDETSEMQASLLALDDDPTKRLDTSGENRAILELTGSPTTPVKVNRGRIVDDDVLELPEVAQPASRRPIYLATALALGLALVVGAFLELTPNDAPAVGALSAPADTGTPRPTRPVVEEPQEPVVAPATAAVAGAAQAPPPAEAQPQKAVPPPPPKPRAPSARPPKPKPQRPKQAAPSKASGSLEVACLPWCEITIDGKPTGKTSPLRGHVLPAGEHLVEVLNPPSGSRATRTVTVTPGETARVNFRLP